jgi:hypothetical protein
LLSRSNSRRIVYKVNRDIGSTGRKHREPLQPVFIPSFHSCGDWGAIDVHLVEMHLPLPLFFSQDCPARPFDQDILPILEHVLDCPVEHDFVAVISKREDLEDRMLAFLDGAGPEAVAELEDLGISAIGDVGD